MKNAAITMCCALLVGSGCAKDTQGKGHALDPDRDRPDAAHTLDGDAALPDAPGAEDAAVGELDAAVGDGAVAPAPDASLPPPRDAGAPASDAAAPLCPIACVGADRCTTPFVAEDCAAAGCPFPCDGVMPEGPASCLIQKGTLEGCTSAIGGVDPDCFIAQNASEECVPCLVRAAECRRTTCANTCATGKIPCDNCMRDFCHTVELTGFVIPKQEIMCR